MEKSIPELKAEFVCMSVRKKKNNSFKIHVIILRYIRNVNLLFKKDFKFAELPTKTFSFSLETVLKVAKETNKGDVTSICAKVTKRASEKVAKAEANLN